MLLLLHHTDSPSRESVNACLKAVELSAITDPEVWFISTDSELPHGVTSQPEKVSESCWKLQFSADWTRGLQQKLFFRRALEEGFDSLIRIDLLTPMSGDSAVLNSIFRSLMTANGDIVSAAAGVGGSDVTAVPSGIQVVARRYRTTFLSRIPFELNDDSDLFESDISRQVRHIEATEVHATRPLELTRAQFLSGHRLRELMAETQFRLHRLGIYCSLKYRDLTPARYRDKTGTMYSSHQLTVDEIRLLQPRSLIDLGCGPGFVSRQCRSLGVNVHGVDMAEPQPDTVSSFTQCNLDQKPYPFDIWDYDAILLLDVIEHLSDPEQFLLDLRHRSACTRDTHQSRSAHRPTMILTTPNVAFIGIRLGLLLGRFNYADRGILDMTHRRLFTRESLRQAILAGGYDIETMKPVPAPFAAIIPGPIGRMLNRIAAMAAAICPSLFAFQWLVRCRPKHGTGHLSPGTEEVSAAGD
jgi:hypothetical protein